MKIGTNEIEKVYLGTTELEGIYFGTNKAYEKSGGIDEHTRRLYHFDGNGVDTITGFDLFASGVFNISYISGHFGQAVSATGKQNGSMISFGPTYNIATDSFTYDGWVKPTSSSVNYFSFYIYNAGSINGLEFNHSSQQIKIDSPLSGTSNKEEVSWTNDTEWGSFFHFAYVNDASNQKIYVFINGEKMYEHANSRNNSFYPCMYSAGKKTCIFDELRISNVARWTSNFTPPTQPY